MFAISIYRYAPSYNSISYSAGILNPPFFHPQYPAAVNYGAIGVVMGHELTHGFDDGGVQWDGVGTLAPWMDAVSSIGFRNLTNCIINEYNDFTFPKLPAPNSISGVRTQGKEYELLTIVANFHSLSLCK